MVKKWNLLLPAILGLGCIWNSCSTYDLGGMLKADSSIKERFENSTSLPDRDSHPNKITNREPDYAFFVVTDLHIQDSDWDKVGRLLRFMDSDKEPLAALLGDYMYEAGSSLGRLSDSISAQKGLRAFTTVGNHEVYKKGYQNTYRSTFGPTCYYFKVENTSYTDLFIFLDSANGTLGNGQFKWLQSLLAEERASARHCFVFTHANFFSSAGYVDVISTYPIEEQMKLLDVFARHHVTAVFTGHSHVRDQTSVRGVKYITVGSWGQGKRKGELCKVSCRAGGEIGIDFNDDYLK